MLQYGLILLLIVIVYIIYSRSAAAAVSKEGFSNASQATKAYNIDIDSLVSAYDDNMMTNVHSDPSIYTAEMLDNQYKARKLIKAIINKRQIDVANNVESATKNYNSSLNTVQFTTNVIKAGAPGLNDSASEFQITAAQDLEKYKKTLDTVKQEESNLQGIVLDINNLFRMSAEQEYAQKMFAPYGNSSDADKINSCLALPPSPP